MPTSEANAGVLSCCLFGACCRGHKAVQLLAMPCINQPLIKLVFHKYLELLPLVPKIVIRNRMNAKTLIHINFIPSDYKQFNATNLKSFLVIHLSSPNNCSV